MSSEYFNDIMYSDVAYKFALSNFLLPCLQRSIAEDYTGLISLVNRTRPVHMLDIFRPEYWLKT